MTDLIDQDKLKSYLFFELGADERRTLEERFFEDNDLFYEVMELENDLVDRFVSNNLSAEDKNRFEKSLASSPERREKIANANALKSFIKEEIREAEEVAAVAATQREIIEDAPTLWQKIIEFFTFKMPVMQYATAALLLVLTFGTGYLLYERVQMSREMARIKNEQQQKLEAIEKQEKQLQERLEQIQQTEKDLENQLENKNGQTDILSSELDQIRRDKQNAEREQNRLKDELEKLRKDRNLPPAPKNQPRRPPQPTITTIILSPYGSKGPGGGVKSVKVTENTSQVSATLQIPKESQGETFTAQFKGSTLASNIKPARTKAGNRSITIRIPAQQLSANEENVIRVTGSDGEQITYIFRPNK